MSFSFEQLDKRIGSRANSSTTTSYTASLLSQGIDTCAQKLGEEAVETIIAVMGDDRDATIGEAADLLYHFLVLMRASDIPLSEIMDELETRTNQSGLAEKASR